MSRTQAAHLGNKVLFNKEHWEIHKGKSFTSKIFNETLGASEVIELAFKTPEAGEIHVVPTFQVKVNGHLDVMRGCTWSGNLHSGLESPIHNRNHKKNTTSTLTVNLSQASFVTTGYLMTDLTGLSGAIVDTEYIFEGKFDHAGENRGKHEYVLQTGEQYCFRLTSDGATNSGQLRLDWYEEN